MAKQTENQGQTWIKQQVIDAKLCTGCGACVGHCPYQAYYNDRTAIMHECDRQAGRCAAYCPRGPLSLDGLNAALFDAADITPELGACKGLYVTRASDEAIRPKAQHGGTVTALAELALSSGMIDAAVLAGQDDQMRSQGAGVSQAGSASDWAGSKFVVSPSVAMFNDISRGDAASIGVVATPCQALALAKMKAQPWPGDEERVAKLKLVIGLFCGWALDWRKLRDLLTRELGQAKILGMDIPPSGHQCMEVYTDGGTVEIALAKVQPAVRESCNYCLDLTCEFADISVGGSRSPEGWQVDKGWNHVIVRSAAGQRLLDLARQKGVLEFKEVPPGNLDMLKQAALNKKRTCVANLTEMSGDASDLIYVEKAELSCL